jgi:hypothetical protein
VALTEFAEFHFRVNSYGGSGRACRDAL